MAKRVALYARVSTTGQTLQNQLQELRSAAERHGWTVVREYTDHGISGAKGRDKRSGFDALCQAVARKEIDLVAAWSVDRLSRSLQDLVAFLGELKGKGVDLFLHQQGLDTSTPAGRALYQMLGVFSEFERAMIVERVRAGIARARKHGTKTGNPWGRPRLDEKTALKVVALYEEGHGMNKIAAQLGIGKGTVQRLVAR